MTEVIKAGDFVNLAKKKKGRYGKNKRFKNADGSWDSKDEYRRFLFLRDLQKKGTITDLETKVVYQFEQNGVKIGSLKPDFRYRVAGELVVEDFKGNVITREFRKSCKMLKAYYGLDVVIVREPTDVTHIAKVAGR